MSGAAYVPVQIELGPLPEYDDEQKEYDLTGTGVPTEAKEILVYTFVTAKSVRGEFHRGYYEISTTDGVGTQYKQYMNVATGQWITVLNSANLWLPLGGDGKLTATLKCADCEKGIKSIKGDTPVRGEWSNVFIIGYRA